MSYYPPTDWELRDFYREHADALYRSCSFLTCGEADTEVMVREILLKLLNKGMIFPSNKDAKAWLILAAYKLSRKPPKPVAVEETQVCESKNPEMQEGSCSENETSPAEGELAPAGEEVREEEVSKEEPAEVAVAEEVCPEASEAEPDAPQAPVVFPAELRKLSRKDRLIALLYYCEGYRKAEIADLLGAPTFMVGSRLKRIKKRILQETGGDEAC